jgi:hypothetical protein
MLVKYQNTTVVKYPYTPEDLYADHPSVYFPDLTNATLARFNVANVVVTSAPEHDPATQAVEPNGCAYSATRQRWETAYLVRPLTAAETADHLAALQADVVAKTQERLDTFARTRNYDGILSACTYATSTVPKFQAEGQYCVEARDATWAQLYTMLAEVQAGTRPVPTGFEDIEPELPALAWPV